MNVSGHRYVLKYVSDVQVEIQHRKVCLYEFQYEGILRQYTTMRTSDHRFYYQTYNQRIQNVYY